MRRKVRRTSLLFGLVLALACLAIPISPAGAFVNDYAESFNTKQYCDKSHTTAQWDTVAGGLKLPAFKPTRAGLYDTPGGTSEVAVSGDFAYVAAGPSGLQVIDISHPANPVFVGAYDTPNLEQVAVAGDYAYLADQTSGLLVMDITDPAQPTLVGSCNIPGWAMCVRVDGDYAYVAAGDSGLQVVDISDPTNPQCVGAWYPLYDTTWGVAVSGDYAYAASLTCGFDVIDISDRENPTSVGHLPTSDHDFYIAISGDYAYVANWLDGLRVIDITDPANPALVASCDTPGNARRIDVSGDFAYIADEGEGLSAIDISDPLNPVRVGGCNTAGTTYGVAVDGEYAYIADGNWGLRVIRIAYPTAPTLVGSCDTPGSAWKAAISGDYAYVADGTQGLRAIDITDPATPTLAGGCDTPGFSYEVAISGDYAYVADEGTGLEVIDITNPASPTHAGRCATADQAIGIAVSGDYAFVADYDSGLVVVDITSPTSPTRLGRCDTPGWAMGVAVSGDYAFVADGLSGVQVIDITDPANPALAGNYGTIADYSMSVAISGDYAYVADGYYLLVLDITSPTTPTLAASYDDLEWAYSVAISGDYAYVADDYSGLWVLDITDPATPVFLGHHDTLGRAYGVAVTGDYAYVADGGSGLQVVEVFQRQFDTPSDAARSLELDNSDRTITSARLTTTQTDSIRWELSADNGANWIDVLPDNNWRTFTSPGSSLLWRSTHCYTGGGVNPTCTDLAIEWLYGCPLIDGIADIPDDQGGQVRITWSRSDNDILGSPTPITEYAIFRRAGEALTSSTTSHDGRLGGLTKETLVEDGLEHIAFPPGNWDSLRAVPADCEDSYATVLPSVGDSTESGVVFTVFLVRAHTASQGIFYDSPVDSGYSVDNLAPAPPENLMMTSPVALAWDASGDSDFDYFSVYGSGAPGLDSTAALIGCTSGAAMDIAGDVYAYYHVTATDFSGNEGEESSVQNSYSGVTYAEALPVAYALRPNQPNPFAARTSIGFDLPIGCVVSLKVFDAQGRQVRALVDQVYPAGRHSVVWAGDDEGGNVAGSGIYFVRIEAGDFRATTKMLLTR